MYQIDDEMIALMVRRIVEEIDPEQVFIFGSRALGKARPDSDVDLMVVEKEPFGPGRSRKNELLRIRRAISSFPAPKDILLFSLPELEKWRGSLNHIISDILREGKRLYER